MGGIFWIASYPKSGNTWFRMWLRHLRAAHDAPIALDARDTPIASARDWLDATLGFDTADLDPDETDRLRSAVYDWAGAADGVAYHKIHDACLTGDDGTPVIGTTSLGAVYIVRNPLDVAPSYAAHSGRSIDRTIENMGERGHCHNGRRDRLTSQVRQRYLDWSGHVASWTRAAGLPVHVIRYEDMHADPHGTLTRAARFLGLDGNAARIARAVDGSSFGRLRARERASGFAERPPTMAAFFRQGRAGGWRDQLNDAQVARIVADHGAVMRAFGYLDASGDPV